MIHRPALVRIGVALVGLMLTHPAAAQDVLKSTFVIDGLQPNPPTNSPGTGVGNVTLDTATNQFSWNVSWSGLLGSTTVAHFHGPALPSQNAGVQVSMTPASPSSGSQVISAGQAADLLAGLWYANIHSTVFPGGEIRGQVGPFQWADIGFAKAGSNGLPSLEGEGLLTGGSANSMTLSNALPASTFTLIVGLGQLNAPFKGGTLVPTLDVTIFGLPTGPTGTFALPFTWDPILPAGTVLFWQAWIVDAGAVSGLSSSNAVRSTSS